MVMTDPSPEDLEAPKRARRLDPAEAGGVRQARLLPGGDAHILNISPTGLLVENKTRLPVGSTVNIRVQGSSVIGLEGHIVRSRVSAIHRDGSLTYETAIEFERPHPIDRDDTSPAPVRGAARAAAPPGDDDVYVIDTSNDW